MKRNPTFALGFVPQPNLQNSRFFGLVLAQRAVGIGIEVVVSSGGLDKLEVYKRLGVREIWFFKKNKFEIYGLRDESYEKIDCSAVLPNLDMNVLAEYAVAPNPLEAALEFRQKVKEMKG